MKYFDAYKRPNGVPLDVFVDVWVQFRTNHVRVANDPVQETLETVEEVRKTFN